MFEEYADLFKFTGKTVDDNIEFYKKKKSLPMEDLFVIWKKLSDQVENFDERDWTENWPNWHKNFQGFEKHRFEAKFLIQHYLTDVLEELVRRLVEDYTKCLKSIKENVKLPRKIPDDDLSFRIKKEVERQINEKLVNQKRKNRRDTKHK